MGRGGDEWVGGLYAQGFVATSELGHAAMTASAMLPSTPAPASSVEAREMMMCAAPEDGVQVTAVQSVVGCRGVRGRMSAAGMTKAWLAVPARVKMKAVMVFMVVGWWSWVR